MKGINVRKIAAVAGAAVLGLSAVAVADVVYGNLQLVDQNGQPTVKIYVGSKAAISDGVAAANIAAKIASEAYKSSTLTAQVSGTPTCTVGAGTSGAGTCSIIESSKKVTLSVKVPGTVAGAHVFKTLITDSIDRTLANRDFSRSEDNYPATLDASDTSGSITSPLRGTDVSTKVARHLYRIGSGQFTAFADANIVDQQATGATYTEEQAFWVGSDDKSVAYDQSPSLKSVVVKRLTALAYSAKFSGNEYGIPVCTGELSADHTDDWASCDPESNSRTDKHRVQIKFLGENWIISEMTPPNTDLASSTNVTAGGQIKLAKEAKYGIVNVGQSLDAGDFKIRLSDISVAVGQNNTHPAIIDVLDANEQVVGQIQVNPGSTSTFTQSGTGKSVKIHVYKTAPGFTLAAKWAEMAIYNDEITLKDGKEYDLRTSDPNFKNFKVSLLWKNRDYSGASGDVKKPDSLREIVVYQTEELPSKVKAGDTLTFLKGKPVYKLTYDGLDLGDGDYVNLEFSAETPLTLERVATSDGDVSCGNSPSQDGKYEDAKFIQIKTSGNYFGGSTDNLIKGVTVDKFYFDPIGLAEPFSDLNVTATAATGAGALNSLPEGYVFASTVSKTDVQYNDTGHLATLSGTAGSSTFTLVTSDPGYTSFWVKFPTSVLYNTKGNGTYRQVPDATKWKPKVFWKLPTRSCYNWKTVTPVPNFNYPTTDDSKAVRFEKAGDNTAAFGGIAYIRSSSFGGEFDPSTYNGGALIVKEDAGYYGTSSNNPVYTVVPFILGSYPNPFRFKPSDSTSANANYLDLSSNWVTTEPTIITERGSKILSVDSNDFQMKVATRVGMAKFTFASADSTASDETEDYVLKVGQSKVFGGVTVTVKAIDATAGSCSVVGPGGAPACTVDSTSLKAVVMPNNAESVTVMEPYKGSLSGLVATDAEGLTSNVAILVGGPMVNTLTAEALKDTEVDLRAGPVVKDIGKKIVVAGYTAEDTLRAAEMFISAVKRQ